MPGWGLMLAGGVISLLVGVMLYVTLPWSGLWVVGTLIAVELIVHGVSWIQFGLALRSDRLRRLRLTGYCGHGSGRNTAGEPSSSRTWGRMRALHGLPVRARAHSAVSGTPAFSNSYTVRYFGWPSTRDSGGHGCSRAR